MIKTRRRKVCILRPFATPGPPAFSTRFSLFIASFWALRPKTKSSSLWNVEVQSVQAWDPVCPGRRPAPQRQHPKSRAPETAWPAFHPHQPPAHPQLSGGPQLVQTPQGPFLCSPPPSAGPERRREHQQVLRRPHVAGARQAGCRAQLPHVSTGLLAAPAPSRGCILDWKLGPGVTCVTWTPCCRSTSGSCCGHREHPRASHPGPGEGGLRCLLVPLGPLPGSIPREQRGAWAQGRRRGHTVFNPKRPSPQNLHGIFFSYKFDLSHGL